MQSRRGFLRMIGLGAAAVAVGPTILRLAQAPKVDAVTAYRKLPTGDELNDYFAQAGRRMREQILRELARTNPFLALVEPQQFIYSSEPVDPSIGFTVIYEKGEA